MLSTPRSPPAPCSRSSSRSRPALAATASASTRRPAAARSSPSTVRAGRRAPLRSMRSRPQAPRHQRTLHRTASQSQAPSPAGNCCSTPMGRRALTNCFSPPSAAPKKAFRCISAWPGTGRCTRASCVAPDNTLFLPGGRAPREGDRFVQTRARRHAARHRQARRGRFLHRAGRRRHGGDASRARRRADGRGFRRRPERRRVRRADLDPMARPRRLAVPAQRAGSGRADDSGRARSARRRSRRTCRVDAFPPAHRGGAHGLPRPGRVPRRPTPEGDAVRPPALSRLSRRARQAHRRPALPSRFACPGRDRARAQAAIPSHFRSSTATAAPAASSTRSTRPSAAASSPKARACSCRTADCASPSSPAIRTASRPTRAPRTPSCREWRRGTASRQSVLA